MNINDKDFYLIKQELVDRVTSIEKNIAILSSEIKACTQAEQKTLDAIQINIEKLNHIILGNGQAGLAENVRGLKESENSRKGHIKIIYSALVIGFGEWVWRMVGHLIK